MSQTYHKEKYEIHPINIQEDQLISITANKSRFTLCEIDTKPQKTNNKISDENYLKALKLHNNPRSQSSVTLSRHKPIEDEYSNDFESEISEKPEKLSLAELKQQKKILQKEKKRIEQMKKIKAENLSKKSEEKKFADEQVAKEEFFRWHEDKKRQILEIKKMKAIKDCKKNQEKEEKLQGKIEKKFREMEERQKRLSKLKCEPVANKRERGFNKDFPTILAYSTSRKIKSQNI